MLGTNISFEGVKGVGTIALELQPDQRVYTFIGINGIGNVLSNFINSYKI